MNSENEKWEHLTRGYPGDFVFRGKLLPIFSLALDEFTKLSQGKWSLDNYEITGKVSNDESYAAISFLPDPAHMIDGIPFEVADRGMYKNGMGVTYVYSLLDLTLVKKIYMR